MDVLAPYICTWCGGMRGYCHHCGAAVHADEFFPGVGCVVCNERVRWSLIDAKMKREGTEGLR
jgi:DNA-directed RNA polymerase subunit RPC12/RpoP